MSLDRGDIVTMLASYRDRLPDGMEEHLGSLELAWLLHSIEQRYGVELDLPDEALARMGTISGAVYVLRGALGEHDDG